MQPHPPSAQTAFQTDGLRFPSEISILRRSPRLLVPGAADSEASQILISSLVICFYPWKLLGVPLHPCSSKFPPNQSLRCIIFLLDASPFQSSCLTLSRPCLAEDSHLPWCLPPSPGLCWEFGTPGSTFCGASSSFLFQSRGAFIPAPGRILQFVLAAHEHVLW